MFFHNELKPNQAFPKGRMLDSNYCSKLGIKTIKHPSLWEGLGRLFNVLSNFCQIVLHPISILMVDAVKKFLELIADL